MGSNGVAASGFLPTRGSTPWHPGSLESRVPTPSTTRPKLERGRRFESVSWYQPWYQRERISAHLTAPETAWTSHIPTGLGGLITRRSWVQIPPPLLENPAVSRRFSLFSEARVPARLALPKAVAVASSEPLPLARRRTRGARSAERPRSRVRGRGGCGGRSRGASSPPPGGRVARAGPSASAPTKGFGMTGVAALACGENHPNGVKLAVLAEEVTVTEDFRPRSQMCTT
jgi:hypothetical protein